MMSPESKQVKGGIDMKRTIWTGAFAALIAMAISAPLVAQPPQGPGGRGPGRGGFGGPMGPGGPGMGLPMLRELFRFHDTRKSR